MKFKCLVISLCMLANVANASDVKHKWHADILLRYENETNHVNLKDRERMRVIAHAGVKSKWSDTWSTQLRLSTGLKNKQNVPAITVHRLNEQPLPDKDIFIERAFIQAYFSDLTVNLGKIPWGSKQVTDIFWDRHLNPIGGSLNWKLSKHHSLYVSQFKPLDGQSSTVGDMTIIQWQSTFDWQGAQWALMPWFVNYEGESGATYARKDTAISNQFLRLSTYVKLGKWRLGADLGQSLKSSEHFPLADFNHQKNSYAVELRHGGLKPVGGLLTQLRVFRVERYAVIGEFAQNAVSRFTTNNMKGWDLRIRRKMNKNWWLGMRYSDTETLIGTFEQGKRFRIETKYSF